MSILCHYCFVGAIFMNKDTFIRCYDTNCKTEFGIDVSFNAAALTDGEVETFEIQLNKNCMPATCPNAECQAPLSMKDVNTNKVQCRKCKGPWFCKECTREWPADSNDYMKCGYDDCDSFAQKLKILQDCERKDYKFGGCVEKNVPSKRMCEKCGNLLEWTEKCKHATCPICKNTFCFVCLKPGHDCKLHIPCQAKEQN